MNLPNSFNQSRFRQYADYLKSQGLSDASISRKLSSLSTFQKYLLKKKLIEPQPLSPATPIKPLLTVKSKIPTIKWFNRYLLVALFILFISGLGYGLYSQTILKAKKKLAYSTAANPVRSGRVISFQGRLTDSSGNPITSSTNILFELYTAGTGGTQLYTSAIGNSLNVVPDENGIFSVVIGRTHGTEIPSTVFSENPEVWLQIISAGETMTPRQQIATVGYAMNAETLQGLPPSASGLKNTVMVIDEVGNLKLGESSPTIKSTSGTLGIEGQALLLSSVNGLDSANLKIDPVNPNGAIQLVTTGNGSSNSIVATNTNLSTGNLFLGKVGNDNRGYNFISFQNFDVGGTDLQTRFSVNASGDLYTAGNINASIGITTPNLQLTSVPLSTGTTALFIDTSGNLTKRGLGSLAFSSATYDNYQSWNLLTNGTGSTAITSNANVNFVNGVGISLSQSGSSVTITNTSVGTTYAAGSGLTLASNVFKLGGALTENMRLNIGNTEALFINSTNGYVGIGTTNPQKKLQITDDQWQQVRITGTNAARRAAIEFENDNSITGNIGIYSSNNGNAANNNNIFISSADATKDIMFGYGNFVEAMRIRGNGNVGIGTTNPTAKLSFATDTTPAGGINFGGDTNLYRVYANILQTDDEFWSTSKMGVNTTADSTIDLNTSSSTAIESFRFLSNNTLKHQFGNYTGNNEFFIDSYNSSNVKKTSLTLNADNLLFNIDPNKEGWKMTFGGDTNLYRSSTGVLKTDNNLSVGGTTTTGSLSLTNTAVGGSSVTAYISGNSGLIGYLDTTSWDKSTADDYSSWLLQSNGANTVNIGTGNTVNFINGVGISLSQSGSTITINNTGIGTTYAAYNGLHLTALNQFGLGGTLSQNVNLTIGNTSAFFINSSNGNVGIGITNPQTKLTLASTSDLESATLGSELLDSSNWTLGAGWSGDFTVGFKHSSGTATLTNTLAAVVGNYYQIAYTVTNQTTGSFAISFGGESKSGITATGTFGPKATTTDSLVITPTTDFDGTVIISIKQITSNYSPIFAIYDSTNTSSFEIRNSPASLYNTFVGKDAGAKNTTGYYNSAQGYGALYLNTTGYANSAQGYAALNSNTSGYNNSALGRTALYSNTTGYNNSALGRAALYSNTTGYNNSAQGIQALYSNTTGNSNSALGVNALYSLTGTYNNNTALGYNAGRYYNGTTGNLTSVSNSLFLGASASALVDGGTNEIVIGYNTIGNGSNSVTLGNDSITKTILKGNVGIGTTAPSKKLDVSGDINLTGTIFANGYTGSTGQVLSSTGIGLSWIDVSAVGTTYAAYNGLHLTALDQFGLGGTLSQNVNLTIGNTSAFFINSSNGNVGIGITNPQTKLTLASTSDLESATLGSELLDSSNWTLGAGWSGDFTVGFKHSAGTAPLINSLAAVVGNYYQIDYTITNGTGPFNINFGGQTKLANSSSGSFGLKATTTDSLSINPPSPMTPGTLFLSIKQVTSPYSPVFALYDSTNTSSFEIRNSPSSLENTFIGNNAGKYNVNGNLNVAIGANALSDNISGYNNSAIGAYSLYSNSAGFNNSAMGMQSLYSNTTGYRNSAFGVQSLYSNTTGYENVAMGMQSLYSNTTGYRNLAIGTSALYSNTTGNQNSALGYSTLSKNTTGNYNTALGYYALYSNTTSNDNSALGYYTLYANTTGYSNSAIGNFSLNSNTTGYENVAIGMKSLYLNTTGYENIAIGMQSLYSNTTGYQNLAIGTSALYSNTTGYENVAMGVQSLVSNTTGFSNSALGSYALNSNTTGYSNSALGKHALGKNNGGFSNSALGSYALYFNTTGTQNSALGSDALGSITTGSNNSALGVSAGTYYNGTTGILTSADYSLFLGASASALANGSGNEIVIGYYAIGNGSNSATLGNDSITKTILKGNVGLGTTAPSQKLDVSGKIALDGVQTLYRPTAMTGSLIIGNGGNNLSHTTSWEGYYNTFIGLDSGLANTTGYGNLALGASTLGSNTTGSRNTAIGAWALEINDANDNTALGYSTMELNTTGYSNTAIGSYSLEANTEGKYNSSLGYKSLNANTTGYQNAVVGSYALSLNTTGYKNSAFGDWALGSNTTGYENSALGGGALGSNTEGTGNVAVGNAALVANTIADYNTAIGIWALANNTADENIAVGAGALSANTSGANNTAVGTWSLNLNTTGYQNSALGYQSLTKNTTGYANTAFGAYSLKYNTTGVNNTAMGVNALTANTTGTRNVAIGTLALQTNTIGSYNTALGHDVMEVNTEGESNTGVGSYSLAANTTGDENSALGGSALISNTTGSGNAVLGYSALYGNTTGYRNVAIGRMAGAFIADGETSNTTSNTSLYLGGSTKSLVDGGTNEIVIGYGTIGNGSNSATLGNDSITKTILKGNVGIGTTAPSHKLDVIGNAGISGNLSVGGTLTISQGAQNNYVLTSDASGNARWAANSSSYTATNGLSLNIGSSSAFGLGGTLVQDTTIETSSYNLSFLGLGGTQSLFLASSGKVGIGTTDPSTAFQVNGIISASKYTGLYNDARYFFDPANTTSFNSSLSLHGNGSLTFNAETIDGVPSTILGTASTRLKSFADGFGIATNIGSTGIGSTIVWNEAIYVKNNGNVGIGTSNPQAKFHVAAANSIITNTAGDITINAASNSISFSGDQLINYSRSLVASGSSLAPSYSFSSSVGTGLYSPDVEMLGIATSGVNRITISSNGNVGIGTTSPGYKLTVNGQPAANGYTAFTNYSDARLKTNINSLSNGYLDKILALNPSTFNYNELTGYDSETRSRTTTGFIAQELQNIFPEMVGKTTINGVEYLDTNLSALPLYTIKAIQELNTKIENISVSDNGQIIINSNISNEVLASLGYSDTKNEIESASYSLTDSAGSTVNTIGQFAKASIASLKTGLISTTNLIAETIVAETTKSKNINTAVITPLSDITDTIVIDGNASVSGTLTAEDASIAGTLYANQINTKDGSITDIMSNKISELRSQIQDTISTIATSSSDLTPETIASGWTYDIGTSQVAVDGSLSLSDNLIVGGRLAVIGDSQLSNAFVTGTFTVGEIAIQDNFIETVNTALYIQPSNSGSVHLMGDTLVIADNGEVTVNGNFQVTGKITANMLVASDIQSSKANIIDLTTTKLNIATDSALPAIASAEVGVTSTSTDVASTEAGEATSSAVIIADPSFADLATSSAKLASNATAGTAVLPTGKTELVIDNPHISNNSMIYLTPVGSTNNQVVYLKSKFVSPAETSSENDPSQQSSSNFVIAIDQPLYQDININWWIIN